MPSYWDLYFHLKTLHVFGLLCCEYNKDMSLQPEELIITKLNEIQAFLTFILVQIGLIIMLIYHSVNIKEFHLSYYNETGNQYISVSFSISCLLLSSIYIYFYINRKRNVTLLLIILSYYKNCKLESAKWSFRINYFVYIFITIICFFTYKIIYENSELTRFAALSYIILFSSIVAICGLVILVYVCMVNILQLSLKQINDELKNIIQRNSNSNIEEFKEIITKRNDLLTICYRDISHNYSFVILLIITYVIITAPSGPFYTVTVTIEKIPSNVEIIDIVMTIIISFCWEIPWMVTFAMISVCNGIAVESKKTTKILIQYGCTRSDKHKIIDKFLMKNLYQKPILTAWGFFALEKRTIFQLVASITTYIMILVQFKDLENGTKPSN